MIGLMNISEAMSIALHTCARLALEPDTFVSVRTVSKEMGFSPHHVAKVAQQLSRAGLIETERGPSGGAKLARPAEETVLLDIYIAAGGTAEFSGCLLKHDVCRGKRCALGKLIARENQRLVTLLRHTTLASVVKSLKRNTTPTSAK